MCFSRRPGLEKSNPTGSTMKTITSIIAVALLTATLTTHAAIFTIGGPIGNPANGHTYYLLSTASWPDSEAFAQTLGGHLATVNDAAENQWIFNTFPALTGVAQPTLWIGLNDAAVEGTFVWASGEPVSFTFWAPGEPNNTPNADPTGEDYAAIRPPGYSPAGSWNDLPTNGGGAAGAIFGVVEVVPEPNTCALVGLGMLGALAFRKAKKH